MEYLKTKQPFFALHWDVQHVWSRLCHIWEGGHAAMHMFYHENGRQSLHWLFLPNKLLYCIFRDDCTMYHMNFGFR